jgi:hypothetical protein
MKAAHTLSTADMNSEAIIALTDERLVIVGYGMNPSPTTLQEFENAYMRILCTKSSHCTSTTLGACS